jgi:hypothetical protein
MFDVKTDEGVVTGRVDGIYMDAAVAGDTAGLEVSLETAHAFDQARGTRHRKLELTLDMTPQTMRELAVLLAQKSGLPALNEREWRMVAQALLASGESELADQVATAYGWTGI